MDIKDKINEKIDILLKNNNEYQLNNLLHLINVLDEIDYKKEIDVKDVKEIIDKKDVKEIIDIKDVKDVKDVKEKDKYTTFYYKNCPKWLFMTHYTDIGYIDNILIRHTEDITCNLVTHHSNIPIDILMKSIIKLSIEDNVPIPKNFNISISNKNVKDVTQFKANKFENAAKIIREELNVNPWHRCDICRNNQEKYVTWVNGISVCCINYNKSCMEKLQNMFKKHGIRPDNYDFHVHCDKG